MTDILQRLQAIPHCMNYPFIALWQKCYLILYTKVWISQFFRWATSLYKWLQRLLEQKGKCWKGFQQLRCPSCLRQDRLGCKGNHRNPWGVCWWTCWSTSQQPHFEWSDHWWRTGSKQCRFQRTGSECNKSQGSSRLSEDWRGWAALGGQIPPCSDSKTPVPPHCNLVECMVESSSIQGLRSHIEDSAQMMVSWHIDRLSVPLAKFKHHHHDMKHQLTGPERHLHSSAPLNSSLHSGMSASLILCSESAAWYHRIL